MDMEFEGAETRLEAVVETGVAKVDVVVAKVDVVVVKVVVAVHDAVEYAVAKTVVVLWGAFKVAGAVAVWAGIAEPVAAVSVVLASFPLNSIIW